MPPHVGSRGDSHYDISVFVNCPFDEEYRPLFEAMVFAVLVCGFKARCALEAYDGGTVRIEKISALIGSCRWGIHDISRTELNDAGLPRFNMPFELGLFLGAGRFGNVRQRRKTSLVLDRTPFRYQAFLSDIAGQDISTHDGRPDRAIHAVRQWLATEQGAVQLPGGAEICRRYDRFRADLPLVLQERQLTGEEVTYGDYLSIVAEWLSQAAPAR